MADPGGLGGDVDLFGKVDLFRLGQHQVVSGKLDFDDMRAQQGRDLRAICGDVNGRFAIFGDGFAARVGPDDRGNAFGGSLLAHGGNFFEHVQCVVGTRINGKADGRTPKAQGVVDSSGYRLVFARCFRHQAVGRVDFQNGRDLPCERIRPRLQHPQRGGIGVQPGINRQLVMVMRIIRGGVGGKAARGTMLEALIDRQDDQLASARQIAFHHHAAQICLYAGRFALVIAEDFLDGRCRAHMGVPCKGIAVSLRLVVPLPSGNIGCANGLQITGVSGVVSTAGP